MRLSPWWLLVYPTEIVQNCRKIIGFSYKNMGTSCPLPDFWHKYSFSMLCIIYMTPPRAHGRPAYYICLKGSRYRSPLGSSTLETLLIKMGLPTDVFKSPHKHIPSIYLIVIINKFKPVQSLHDVKGVSCIILWKCCPFFENYGI